MSKKKKKQKEYEVEICRGVEGICIYLNGYRIVGPKPWGGGEIIQSWAVLSEDLDRALRGEE